MNFQPPAKAPDFGTVRAGIDRSRTAGLSNNIWHQMILAPANFIPQKQFAFFQTGDLHHVGHEGLRQRKDRVVQVSMFDFQQLKALCQFIHIHDYERWQESS